MMPSARWISAALLAVLLSGASAPRAQECDSSVAPDGGCHHRQLPLVYNAENTGARYPAPVFPPFAQLPIVRPLPDPFTFFDGSHRDASAASWERRRNEIKAAIEKYEIGPKPDCSDCTITASYTPAASGSNTGSLTVVVTRNGKSLTLNERVYIPQGVGNGPFPAVIAMSLAFPPFFVPPIPNYGSLPASVFAGQPVATIDFFHNDVTEYSFFGVSDHTQDPFYQLYPELCAGTCTGTSNSGQYAAWAWGVSRLIDGIEIASHQAVDPLPIDVRHLAVTGCSYAGKMALFAGAFDERVALTIAQENGGGGAPAWRVSHEIEAQGSVEDVDDTDYNWFAGQMRQFAGDNVYKLPVDHHELMAMVAPRALLETGNTDFYWLSNRSNYISARATQEIYDTLGIGGPVRVLYRRRTPALCDAAGGGPGHLRLRRQIPARSGGQLGCRGQPLPGARLQTLDLVVARRPGQRSRIPERLEYGRDGGDGAEQIRLRAPAGECGQHRPGGLSVGIGG